ncbi:MAG: hypothetical protein GY765_07475 [bacterium]|nr:hypothetical protein [bacterium]
MTNEIKNTESWITARGSKIEIISGLDLKKTVYVDGNAVEVNCCEKTFRVEVNGKLFTSDALYEVGYPKEIQGKIALASLGNMFLTEQDDVDRIKAVVAKTESHPAWVAKQEKIKMNEEEIYKMESQRMANGYCPK